MGYIVYLHFEESMEAVMLADSLESLKSIRADYREPSVRAGGEPSRQELC